MRIAILLSWLFAACVQATFLDLPPPQFDAGRDNGDDGSYPTWSFKTFKDDVKAPKVNFLQWSPECDDGRYYFLTPRGWSLMRKPGPMILDSRGELIWAHHYEDENRFGAEGYNFLMQQYEGKDHLTFWIGEDRVKGHGAGIHYFVNSSYDIVDRYHGDNGMFADLHEFLVTDHNTTLMTLYKIVPKDVTMLRKFDPEKNPKDHDPNFVWDGIVQEIDLKTHKAIWQWRATENVAITDTYRPIRTDGNHENPFDWFHINSVQKDEFGNYLISTRFLQSILYVDGKTKKTLWRLGGKRNTFMDLSGGNGLNFAWQHDARFRELDTFPSIYTAPPKRPGYTTKLLTFFDNASENQNYTYGLPQSRGLLLELTFPTPGTQKAIAGARKHNHQHPPEDLDAPDLNEAKVAAINGSDPDYTVRVIQTYTTSETIRSSSQGNLQVIPQGPGQDPKVLVGYGLDAAWTEFAANGTVLCHVHYGAKTQFETGDMQSYRIFKLPWTGRPKWNPNVVVDYSQLYVSWLGATDIAEWALESAASNASEDGAWREVLRTRKVRFEETIEVPTDGSAARYLRLVALDRDGNRMEHGVSEVVYLGFLAAYLPEVGYSAKSTTIFVAVACVTTILVIVYGVYRWRPSWQWKKPWASKEEQAYQLVEQDGDEE